MLRRIGIAAMLVGCACTLLSITTTAQNKTIDSLQLLLKTGLNDSMRSLIFAELASNYSGYDTAKATSYLKQASQLSNWDYNKGYYYQSYATYESDRARYNNNHSNSLKPPRTRLKHGGLQLLTTTSQRCSSSSTSMKKDWSMICGPFPTTLRPATMKCWLTLTLT